MTKAQLEGYLHEHIPLSRAMQVSVVTVSTQEIVLRAPLAPNINHRDTVFGGSASALAILSAWCLVHTRMQASGRAARLVIQRNEIEYSAPIFGAFIARAAVESATWERFVTMFDRKGKARITIASTLASEANDVGRFTGDFVALRQL